MKPLTTCRRNFVFMRPNMPEPRDEVVITGGRNKKNWRGVAMVFGWHADGDRSHFIVRSRESILSVTPSFALRIPASKPHCKLRQARRRKWMCIQLASHLQNKERIWPTRFTAIDTNWGFIISASLHLVHPPLAVADYRAERDWRLTGCSRSLWPAVRARIDYLRLRFYA
jgi:hypothetical protein